MTNTTETYTLIQTVSSVIQAVSVPLTVFFTYLIFRFGQRDSSTKYIAELNLHTLQQSETLLHNLNTDLRNYYETKDTLQSTELQLAQYKIISSTKDLTLIFSTLEKRMNCDNFFTAPFLELYESVTGMHTNFHSTSATSDHRATLHEFSIKKRLMLEKIEEMRKNIIETVRK